jgi:hypothetical protein
MSYKFVSHLQKLGAIVCVCVYVCMHVCIFTLYIMCVYIRIGNNVHVNLFDIVDAATYTIESELHGVNLKMLHNNMQKKTSK